MTTQPRRSLRDLLKSKYKSPKDLLRKLGFSAEEFLPAMAFDSRLGASNMSAPTVKAKDVLSKQVRRNLDAMSPGMRQALRQHLGKGDDLHQSDLHLHVGPRGARDQEQNGNSLSPVVASALWQHLAPQIDDETARENLHVLLQQLCGDLNFADLDAEDQLPLIGAALGGLGEAAGAAGEAAAGGAGGLSAAEGGLSAAEGALIGSAAASGGGGGGEEKEESEDQSFAPPGPRNFGAMPRPGGSMTPPRPYTPDKSSRGAMDEAMARITNMGCSTVYSNGTPFTGRLSGVQYRHGVPFGKQPSRRQHVALALDAASKPARKENKQFSKHWPEAARIKVI